MTNKYSYLNRERIKKSIRENVPFEKMDCTLQMYRNALKQIKESSHTVHFGHKNEPYYTDEDYTIPEYKIDDLKGDELEIYNNLLNKGYESNDSE